MSVWQGRSICKHMKFWEVLTQLHCLRNLEMAKVGIVSFKATHQQKQLNSDQLNAHNRAAEVNIFKRQYMERHGLSK